MLASRSLAAIAAVVASCLALGAWANGARVHADVPPTTSTAPPAGPLANPWPRIGRVPPGHHVVLGVGDSTLGGGVFELPGVLASHGFDVTLYDAHVNASGLLDPMNGVSPHDYLEQQFAAHPDVDTVLFHWVSVCAVGCGPGKLAYGSAQFYGAWIAATRDLIDDARAHGAKVVWAVSPPQPPPPGDDPPREDWFSLPMRFQVSNELATRERRYAHEFGIATVDWFRALSDTSGQWQSQLWYDGALHTVRLDDGVHLTEDGSTRTSVWTAAALARLWRADLPRNPTAKGKRAK